jgi:hypothetical protein
MKLARRSFLRGALNGAAVSIALPTLEAMLDGNGAAYADGTPIPRRFGVWFWGNGVKRDGWTPTSTGRGWAAPPSLKPFADAGLLDYVSVVTKTWVPFAQKWAHHSSYKALWCGAEGIYDARGFPAQYGGPKFDDVIENAWRGKTRISSVNVGVSRCPGNVNYLSGDPKSAMYNPQALFDQLFGVFKPSMGSGDTAAIVAARKSLLDAVATDATELAARLPAGDRARLQLHLDSIRDVERSLDALKSSQACALPPRPDARPADMAGLQEPLVEVNKAMADLVTLALACDVTRVFRFTFTHLQSDTIFWPIGLLTGHHGFGHNEAAPQPIIQKSVVFTMQQLAYLVGKLKAVPVGAGNLLDQCCIFGASEQADPQNHSPYDVPTLVIGRAGGALRSGIHYGAGGINNFSRRTDVPGAIHTRVLTTIMKAVGVPQPAFGAGPGRVTDTIAELEA